MPVTRIAFDKIERNPYRDTVSHPPSAEQIEMLKASIELTSFWEGLLVRKHPAKPGYYQLAFGHTRLEAARTLGMTEASFNVVDLNEAQMIQHLAMENLAQDDRNAYQTYREVVTAAIEHLMADVIAGRPISQPNEEAQRLIGTIKGGGMPGREVVGRFFGGVLSRKAIDMVIEEYKASGRLAAWHRGHNPEAGNHAEAPTLSVEALAMFKETAHAKTFADTMRHLGVPVVEQASVAGAVLERLKEPETRRGRNQTAENERLNRQWARRDQPRDERLTSNNIRSVARKIVSDKRTSPRERDRLRAEAHAISIEGAMTEMSIGLRRASAAASDIARVAMSIGGLRVDLTPASLLRLAECQRAVKDLEASLKGAAKHGVRIPLTGGRARP